MHKRREFPEEVDQYEEVVHRYIKAIDKGILKVMSKMGISTYQSYCGAQIFDADRPEPRTSSDRYFTGTATTIEGAGLRRDRRPRPCAATAAAFGDSIPSCAMRWMSAATTCLPAARRSPRLDARRR